MAEVSPAKLISIFTEIGLFSAYQSLAAQLISDECMTEEDLLLIELEALASIGEIHLDEKASRPMVDQAAQDAKNRLHNSFAAFRRARRMLRRPQKDGRSPS